MPIAAHIPQANCSLPLNLRLFSAKRMMQNEEYLLSKLIFDSNYGIELVFFKKTALTTHSFPLSLIVVFINFLIHPVNLRYSAARSTNPGTLDS